MPVLIVSENTWPHEGFSRNRSTRPSSSVTTIPNSSGLSTDFNPIVTAAPFARCAATSDTEVDVAERVAGDDEKRLVEACFGQAYRAGRAERLLLDRVVDRHAEPLAVAEVRPDRLRHERQRDHRLAHAVSTDELEDVLDAGLPDDRHHRLRLVRGERSQPRPLPACHDDRFHVPTSRRALSTYCPAANTARARLIQKHARAHHVPASVTRTSPIEA